MWLLLAFIAVPLIEIALFIQVGGAIGLGWTLATVIFTAVLGSWLVRTQGIAAISSLKSSFNELRDPTGPLLDGALILFSGALLLTPGFFTDAVGFALLVPAVRKSIFLAVRNRVKVSGFQAGSAGHDPARPGPRPSPGPRPVRGDVIEGDYSEVGADDAAKNEDRQPRSSGWTKH